MIKTFVKKPVKVQAVQWTGDNYEELADFVGFHCSYNFGSVGDWIIRGVNGEFYPCKPDIFEKTYVEVERRMQIKNAIIRSTMLGREDHGIMTFMIYIDGDSFTCGVGGYCLDEFNAATQTRVFRAESMEAISKVLEVVGVDKWEDLPGKYIRFEDNGWGSTVTKIGNIIKDKWFDLEEFFMYQKEKTK